MWKTWLAAPVAVAVLGFSLGFAAVLKSETGRNAWSAASGAATTPGASKAIGMSDDRLAALDGPGEVRPATTRAAPVQSGAPAVGRDRHVALVIGNGSYPDDGAALTQPVNDARAVADELRGRGFDVVTGENLTRQGMDETIEAFNAKVTPNSTALIFFSGYGIQAGRQSYLIPVDAQIWREADVRRDGIGIEPILADLDQKRAATKLLVIDASRRNPYERRFRGLSIGLAPISTPAGTLVIYGAAPGTVARDSDDQHSLFAAELLREIRSEGVSVEDIFNRTRLEVARVSQGERVPGVFSSLTGHVFFAQSKTPPPSRQSAR